MKILTISDEVCPALYDFYTPVLEPSIVVRVLVLISMVMQVVILDLL